ncbi:MAG: hypothetical protein KGY78_11000 [Anaerolineae bacterium]|nr:hypothetical protein [Anaerolineae bacterium]
MKCKYCATPIKAGHICEMCQDLIEVEEQNRREGLCPFCRGSCENSDGTPCYECGGEGIL